MKQFFKKFDKKRLRMSLKLSFVFIVLIVVINIIGTTYTRYETSAELNAKANIAYFILDSGNYTNTISLDGLTPSEDVHNFVINVSNFKDSKRADVNIEYTITLEATTNIPLSFQLLKNESGTPTDVISTTSYYQDGDMYIKEMTSDTTFTMNYDSNITHQFTLAVTFPEIYKNMPNNYQGKIDLLTVTIHAEQVA